MRRTPQLLLASFALAAIGCAAPEPEGTALAWHDSVMTAMGGRKAWEKTRYLQFRWNVIRDGRVVSERMHYWDRWDGSYRLETTFQTGTGPQHGGGQNLVVYFNVNSQQGQAFIGGIPFGGALGDSLVKRAHAWFINDSFWLLMPYKWRDPGVNPEYLGHETNEYGDWEVVHLSFDDVGLTPGDQYWVYIDAGVPRLVRMWQYHLQGRENKGLFIRWQNWQRFGDILLATERESVDGSLKIEFTDIRAERTTDPSVFTPPQTN